MVVEATERWDGVRLRRTERGWRASQSFDVTGTTFEMSALKAPGIPRRGTPHPEQSRLLLTSKEARRRAPTLWTVDCSYTIPEGGSLPQDEDEEEQDPLNEAPVIDFQFATESEEFDRTPDGWPIQNSAHKPFDSNPTRDAGPIMLTVERNEPFFDGQKAVDFRNLVNTDPVRIDNVALFGPRVGRVLSMEPVSPFQFGQPFVRVRYRIQLRRPFVVDGQVVSAHHVRLMDRGYYSRVILPTKEGVSLLHINDDEGQPITEPHPLNGKGGKLGTNNGAGEPPGLLTTQQTADAVWLFYKRYDEGSYRGLFD